MQEQQPGQEANIGVKSGNAKRIFGVVGILLLCGILSWLFVPSVRVIFYQSILIIGPRSARLWSVKQLKDCGEPAVPALISAFKDKEWGINKVAAGSLAVIGEKAVPTLILVLESKDKELREHSALALGAMSLLEQNGAVAAPAVPALVKALQDKEPEVRKNAASALGFLGDKDSAAIPQSAISALIVALKDKDEEARTTITVVLSSIGEKAVPALIHALKDKVDDVRISAAIALRVIAMKARPSVARSIVTAFIPLLKDQLGAVRIEAAFVLWRNAKETQQALSVLVNLFKEKESRLHNRTANILTIIGGEAVAALTNALKDNDSTGRKWVLLVLGKIGERKRAAITPAVISELINVLNDKNRELRYQAAMAHWKITKETQKAIPVLINVLKEEPLRKRIRKRKRNDKDDLHGKALSALATMGVQAIPALVAVIQDKGSGRRTGASFALKKIAEQSPANIPQSVVPVLADALRAEDPFLRKNAAYILRKLGPKAEKATPALIEALKDTDEDVRKAAKEALEKIQKK
jgi:HEAT repeat protein